MRFASALTLCWLAASALPAAAQKPGPEPKTAERFYVFTEGEIGDDSVVLDGLVRSKRTGNRPAELSVDLCFPVRADSGEIDRFTGPLAAKGDMATASGHSLLGRVKTEVRLKTAAKEDQITVSGEIRYGDLRIGVREQAVPDEEGNADYLFEGEPRSALRGPNEVVIKLDLKSVRPLLDVLRAKGAQVAPSQLIPGCADYREGKQVVQVVTAPARVAALAEAVGAIPGVESVETPEEKSVREDAVHLPDALAKAPERAVVERFAAVARRVLGSARDAEIRAKPATGEYVVALGRDSRTARALGLTEAVAVTVLMAADPFDPDKRMLFITQVGSSFVDPAATPLRLDQDQPETVAYTDLQPRRISATLAAAFAAETGGEAVNGSGPH